MPNLWHGQFSKEILRSYTASPSPLAGLRPFSYAEGRARGMRGIDGWTGSGLRFTLWPDRALDIGPVWFQDKPIAWTYPSLADSAYYEPEGLGWLRSFAGGLLTTCGLTHFGAPDALDGQSFGLHGRIAHIPAENLRIWQEWQGESFVLMVEGTVRQAVLFGENLCLRRRIATEMGSRTLSVTDTVSNEGGRPVPHGLLYHCNFGFPLVSPESRLCIEDTAFEPRDSEAEKGVDAHAQFEEPRAGVAEQVFFHRPKKDSKGFAAASLINPKLGLGLRLKWQAEQMPVLTQWKMMGKGEYVCGLEPATHAMGPRETLAKKNLPRPLEPGETVAYALQITLFETGSPEWDQAC